jgi:DNA damage-inducible protein 1
MELTFVTDLGQTFVVEIDPNMELENVMALLEAEVNQSLTIHASGILIRAFFHSFARQSSIPVNEQSISYEGRELNNPKSTIRQLGVQGENAMLLLRRKVANVGGRYVRTQYTRCYIAHRRDAIR